MMKFWPCLAAILLLGCAHQDTAVPGAQTVAVAPEVTVTLPNGTGLHHQVEISQLVIGAHGDDKFLFQVRISANADHFNMAGLDMMGRRSIGLTWNKDGITSETAAWIPSQLKPEYILADMVTIYWPANAVRQALSGSDSVSLIASPNHRTVTKDGKPVIEIHYVPAADGIIWHSRVHYENLARGYTLDIQSAQAGP